MQGLFSLFTVYAATDWGDCTTQGVATIKCLEPLFSNVVQALVALVGVALFVMFLVAGFSFLFSSGDPKKLEQAKGTLTNAIIGLVIIVGAYIIINLIQAFTGSTTPLTIFKISL